MQNWKTCSEDLESPWSFAWCFVYSGQPLASGSRQLVSAGSGIFGLCWFLLESSTVCPRSQGCVNPASLGFLVTYVSERLQNISLWSCSECTLEVSARKLIMFLSHNLYLCSIKTEWRKILHSTAPEMYAMKRAEVLQKKQVIAFIMYEHKDTFSSLPRQTSHGL